MSEIPTPRTDAAANDSIVKVYETSKQMERELAEAREQIEHLKEHARAKVAALQEQTSERMKAEQQRDMLADAIRSFATDFERIQWGCDGDCGTTRMVDALFESLTP